MLRKNCDIILTCEHATNTIPPEYQPYFQNHKNLLESHRGYDIGAVEIITNMAAILNVRFFQAKASRLLIDNNRSLNNPNCFSFITKVLPHDIKDDIIKNYYDIYRDDVILAMQNIIATGRTVLHLSIHSFTPIFNNKTRRGDIGILYDSSRSYELNLAKKWQCWLQKQDDHLIVRKNYPYFGKTDGLASFCRKLFDKEYYLGFEIESNQSKVILPENQIKFARLFADMSKNIF